MEKTILIFAYYSYKDPVFQSAVLPYFMHFPGGKKFRFVLLTFEHKGFFIAPEEVQQIESDLAANNIIWKRSRWRSGRFKKIKKIIDLFEGIAFTLWLARQYRVLAIYAEGTVGAIISYYAAIIGRQKHLVHTFEPHADYMVESGVWTNDSWETRIARWHENHIAKQATYLFTATQAMIDKLAAQGIDARKIYRTPSCVDLDHFRFNEDDRVAIRKLIGIARDRHVLIYLGKFGGMYMEDEAFEFFKIFQDEANGWIIILSPDDPQKIEIMAKNQSIDLQRLTINYVSRDEMPKYLSASDVGFVGVRQFPSKKFCSPIKTGEYLACGLPVIVPIGVSDDAETIRQKGIGFALKELKKNAYLEVMNDWRKWINRNDLKDIHRQARIYVQEDRSIAHYQKLYFELFEKL